MPYFKYGDCVYLNDIDKISKNYHKIFNQNIFSDINMMSPSYPLEKYLTKFPMIYVEDIIITWMQ